MSAEADFIDYLVETLNPLGPVRAKKMFGGFGIFLDELMFGLVSKNVFYLKVDDKNRSDFEAKGFGPFTYSRKGREYSMSYYEVPHEIMDDVEQLCRWAQKSYDAALRGVEIKLKKDLGKKL
jgi:DNA transformation protein